jgi:hypothetical protein
VSFLIPAAALGKPQTLQGARVYVTTWDYDSGYRALTKDGDGHSLGGGDGARDPLIMDALLLRLGSDAEAGVPEGADK